MPSPGTTSRAPAGSATTSGGPTSGRFRRAGHMAASVARITLLGRPGCHLCDDARTVIERVAADLGVGWEERDITASPDDMREYWDKIPVTLVDGVQVDFWRVSEARLRAALG
jgi:glutaredoxin